MATEYECSAGRGSSSWRDISQRAAGKGGAARRRGSRPTGPPPGAWARTAPVLALNLPAVVLGSRRIERASRACKMSSGDDPAGWLFTFTLENLLVAQKEHVLGAEVRWHKRMAEMKRGDSAIV